MDTNDRISVTMEMLKLSQDQSKSRKEEVSCALSVNKAKKQGMKKAPKRQTSESTVSTAHHATTAEDTTGSTTVTRTPQQETAILRALGLTEGPKCPVTGEIYQIDFLEFRQHLFNKLPLYDGRAVITLGSFRKPRNYKLVCALHPTCPFLLHGKQQIYADGLAYQDIQEVVNHTCSVQSHAKSSLCSLAFLGYLLREQEYLLPGKCSYAQGVEACEEAGKRFGIDFASNPRRQMFYKAAKARNHEQNGASALLAFRSPSPICVTPRPMYKLDIFAKTLSIQLPVVSTERQSDSTAAELAAPVSADSTSHVSSVVPASTGCVAENPHSMQLELKSDQLMFREAKRKLDHEGVMEDNNVVLISQDNEQGFDQERNVLELGSTKDRESGIIRDSSRKEEAQTRKVVEEREEAKGEEQNAIVCVEENPQPRQAERKSESDQLLFREAKRKVEHEGVMDDNHVVRKKRKEVLAGHSDTVDTVKAASPNDWVVVASSNSLNRATCATLNSNPTSPQLTSMSTSTSTPVSSQRSGSAPRKSKQPEYMRLLESYTPLVDERSARTTPAQPNCNPAPQSTSAPKSNQQSPRKSKRPEYMRLFKSDTPLVDELSARATRAPCSSGSSTLTMNQDCGTKTKSDRLTRSHELTKKTPSPSSRSWIPDCEESANTSVLSRADYSFPPRKTRASTSNLQNSSEKRQPDENNQDQQSKSDALNQQPHRKLKPARAILADGLILMPVMDDLPPLRSAASGTNATAPATTEPLTCSTGSSTSTSTCVTKQHFGCIKAKSERLTKDLLLAKIPSRSLTGSSDEHSRTAKTKSDRLAKDVLLAKIPPSLPSRSLHQTSTSTTNQHCGTIKTKPDRLTKSLVLAKRPPSPPPPPLPPPISRSADLSSGVINDSAGIPASPPARTTTQTRASTTTTTSSKILPHTTTSSEEQKRPGLENNSNPNQEISKKSADLNLTNQLHQQQPNHKRPPTRVMLMEQGLMPMMLAVASYLVLLLWYNH